MRTEPRRISEADLQRKKERTENITRIIALCLAAATTFVFFFKLLFL